MNKATKCIIAVLTLTTLVEPILSSVLAAGFPTSCTCFRKPTGYPKDQSDGSSDYTWNCAGNAGAATCYRIVSSYPEIKKCTGTLYVWNECRYTIANFTWVKVRTGTCVMTTSGYQCADVGGVVEYNWLDWVTAESC